MYLYAFEHAPTMPLLPGLGSYHAAEFPFIFGFDDPLAVTQDAEKPLIGFMQGYWGRFAHTGNPNGGGAPMWPKYDSKADQNLSLDVPAPKTETGHKSAKCDFWDMLGTY